MAHCFTCRYRKCGPYFSPCESCFAFSNYAPKPLTKEEMQHLLDDCTPSKTFFKENLMTTSNRPIAYVTYMGRTYQAREATVEMCTSDMFNSLTVEATLAPYNLVESFGPTPLIKDVIFNPPATIVFWDDGSKTVVRAQGDDVYDPEKGLAMAISKKTLGNKYDYYHTFKKYLKKWNKQEEVKEI